MLQKVRKWVGGLKWGGKAAGDIPSNALGFETLVGMLSQAFNRRNEIWNIKGIREMEETYATSLIVYACVKKICQSAQAAPPRIGIERPGGWKDKPNHPLQALLDQPNPNMHYQEFIVHALMHRLLTGRSYIWKWRNGVGEVVQMYPVPTSMVTPVYDSNGEPEYYEVFQGIGRPRLKVPLQNMIVSTDPHPSYTRIGVGPLEAALKEIQTDDERAEYMIEMLTNTRAPGLVVKTQEELSPEREAQFRAVMNGGLGKGRRGRTLFLSGENVEISQQAIMKDIDWPGLAGFLEARGCAAFGVPPILLGLRVGLDSSTYSNYAQARKVFHEDTMVPIWLALDAALTKGLLRDEGDETGVEIYHDTSKIPALREDQAAVVKRANDAFTGSLITRNEAREMIGMEKLDPGQGDVFLLPMSSIEVPLGAKPVEQLAAPAPDDGKKANEAL